jgi:hypothetical protein
MTQAPRVDLQALWRYVTEQVKGKITRPNLWRAMEAAKPITLENDELVLGFDAATAHQGTQITDNQTRNTIEQILEAATRRRLKVRIIQGESLADWEAIKAAQVEAARLQEQTKQQYQRQTEAGTTWEAVGEQIVRRFAAQPHRGLSSVQGRFLEEAVETLAEAYGRLMSEDPSEQDERSYTRILERVAERVNVPAAMIGYLVHTHRK